MARRRQRRQLACALVCCGAVSATAFAACSSSKAGPGVTETTINQNGTPNSIPGQQPSVPGQQSTSPGPSASSSPGQTDATVKP